jgi:hypothetical protein
MFLGVLMSRLKPRPTKLIYEMACSQVVEKVLSFVGRAFRHDISLRFLQGF